MLSGVEEKASAMVESFPVALIFAKVLRICRKGRLKNFNFTPVDAIYVYDASFIGCYTLP